MEKSHIQTPQKLIKPNPQSEQKAQIQQSVPQNSSEKPIQQQQSQQVNLQKKLSQKQKKPKNFVIYPYQRQFLNTIMPLGYRLWNLNQDEENIEKQYLSNEFKALKTDADFKPSTVQDIQLGRINSVQKQQSVQEADRLLRVNKPKVSMENKFCEGNKPGKKYKTEQLEQCAHLLTKLKKFKNIGETFCKFSEFCQQHIQFHDPVDLLLIEQNLKKGRYNDHKELEKDVERMLDIAFQCNPKNSEIYLKTLEMKAYYQKGLRPIEYNPLEQELNKFQKRLDKITRDLREYSQNQFHFYHRENKKAKLQGIDKQMTHEAKLDLKKQIQELPKFYMRGIWEIVSENPLDHPTSTPVLGFNLDSLSNRKLREIEKYIKSKKQYLEDSRLQRKKKKERKEKDRLRALLETEYESKYPQPPEEKIEEDVKKEEKENENEENQEKTAEEIEKEKEEKERKEKEKMEKEKKRKDEVDKYVESKIPPIHYDLTMTTDSSMISEFEDSNWE